MNKLQKNTVLVLERLIKMVQEDSNDAEAIAEVLEYGIQDLHSNDFFGTEGQNDPRGDFRNGNWSMKKVEKDAS